MTKLIRYAPEVRERAIRIVLEHQGERESQWAAISSIANKIGCTPETLRKWVPVAPTQAMRISFTPRFCSSVSTARAWQTPNDRRVPC